MAVKVVTDQNIGNGLFISAGRLHADPSYGPSTVALTNPSGTNLQVAVNGQTSTLDLTPLIQAGETTTTLTYNPLTKTLTYTNEDGVVSNVDLTALAMDIYVSGGSYNAATMVLTLTDNDGTTPDININLAELKKVTTAGSDTITWSGTGEASDPLIANIKVDPAANNIITFGPAGLKATVATDYGIDGDGTLANPVTFNAAELELHFENQGDPNNTFVMSNPYRPEGTRVSILDAADEMWVGHIQSLVENYVNAAIPQTINAMLTVDVQDLAGTHLFFALP